MRLQGAWARSSTGGSTPRAWSSAWTWPISSGPASATPTRPARPSIPVTCCLPTAVTWTGCSTPCWTGPGPAWTSGLALSVSSRGCPKGRYGGRRVGHRPAAGEPSPRRAIRCMMSMPGSTLPAADLTGVFATGSMRALAPSSSWGHLPSLRYLRHVSKLAAGCHDRFRGSTVRLRTAQGRREPAPRSSLAGRHRLMIWWMQVPPSHCPVTDRPEAGSAADAMPAGVNVMAWPRSPTTGIPRAMGAPSAADGGSAPCVPVPFICGRLSRFSRQGCGGSGVRPGSRRRQYRRRLRRGRAASPVAEAGRLAGPPRQGRPR